MSKYKVGDKVVLTVSDVNEKVYYPHYEFNNKFNLWKQSTDDYAEPLSTYTEPLESKIQKQSAEILKQKEIIDKLLNENEKLMFKIDAYELYGDQHEEEYNQAFNQGAETAWELARKIVIQNGYSAYDLYEIFGCSDLQHVLENYTYPEAAAKVAEWKKTKDEIKVGDIVRIHEGNDDDLCILCVSTDKKYYNAVDEYGAVYNMLTKGMITKTGRHIDVDSFLKQIGGEQE